MWSKGFIILLCFSNLVRTQERISGAPGIEFLTGLGNIASFSVGTLLGFIWKQCPDCPDETATQPTPVMACPDGFTPVELEGGITCYIHISEQGTREDAMLECAKLAPRDGHILAIETDEELDKVIAFAANLVLDSFQVLIGATDYNLDGSFTWNTGTLVSESMPIAPGLSCTALNLITGSIYPTLCANYFAFICESSNRQQP